MRTLFAVLLACALPFSLLAQGAAPKAPASPSKPETAAVATIPASAGVVTAPLVLKDGSISQPESTELAGGGKAVFEFTVAKAGTYEIKGLVNAAGEDTNSFFVNVDTPPEDPLMIWDIDVTNGFEERVVSWRGNGDANSDQFTPKHFTLTAGAHKLIVVGREPTTRLKSISIRPVAN